MTVTCTIEQRGKFYDIRTNDNRYFYAEKIGGYALPTADIKFYACLTPGNLILAIATDILTKRSWIHDIYKKETR